MDPPTHYHHHQERESQQTLESILECTKGGGGGGANSSQQEREREKKAKPTAAEDALKCPRCDSTNTKFCYYNNYSLTQPRYFCKSCRRYWTKGGTLRNVPVGGGCRKNNKRSSSSSSSSSKAISISSPNNPNHIINPLMSSFNTYDSDITLAIARLQSQNVGQMGFGDQHQHGFSILGDQYGALLGNHGLIEDSSIRGGNSTNGFFENHVGGYLGNGGLSLGFNGNDEMRNSMPYVGGQEMGGSFVNSTTTGGAAATTTTVKQEMICNSREGGGGDQSRLLMGFPWQFGGEAGKLVDFEPVKQNWNNGFGSSSSSWHGLLNSPLM